MRRKRAVGWAYGLTWGRQGIQAATTLILAAIVGPAEFGVMALALIYIGFIEMILQQGFVAAIIQRKVLRQSHVTSVFWLLVASSILLAAMGVAFGRYWAAANTAPVLGAVIPVLSLTIPLVALGMVPTALLTRHFRMKALMARGIGSAAVSCAVAIPLAYAGFGVWSLVAMHLSYSTASTVLVLGAARWRPRLEFSWTAARELLPFSVANFVVRLGDFFVTQTDAIVIGLYWGPVAVGLYRLAARLVSMTLEFLSGPLQLVSFPELSKLQVNREGFGSSLLAYLRFATIVTWPFLAIVALAGPYIAPVMGAKWSGVEYVLVPLAVCGAVEAFTQFLNPLLKALGKPGSLAGMVWLQGMLGAIAYAAVGSWSTDAALPIQATSIGIAKSALFLLLPLPTMLYFCRRLLGLPSGRVLAAAVPAVLCAISVYVVGLAVRRMVQGLGWGPITQLMALLLITGGTWITSAFAFSPSVRRLASDVARKYAPWLTARNP